MKEQEKKSLDDLITDEDIKEMNMILEMKKSLLNLIGLENFIDFMRDIIDNSEHFEFTSDIKRKFIDKNNPIFLIRMKDLQIDKKKTDDISYQNSKLSEITSFIKEDILKKTTKYFVDYANNNDKLKKQFDDIDGFIQNIMWTTMYEIKISLVDNIIYLKYCI